MSKNISTAVEIEKRDKNPIYRRRFVDNHLKIKWADISR